jgi:hypothetical protein
MFIAIILLITPFSHYLPLFDYVEYWSAGKLNLSGINPYGMNELSGLQTKLGWKYPDPLISWNPPWTQLYLMPIALLPYDISRSMWLILSVVIMLFTSQQTWQKFGGQPNKKMIAAIVAITFSPVFFNLMLGQISPLILLGLIGFLKWIETSQDSWRQSMLVGFFASLTAIKPQLMYLFLVAVITWALSRKNWAVILGFGLSLILETFIASWMNPALIPQYLIALWDYPPTNWATPTLGYYLRLIFGENLFWLQFIPSILGLAWFFYYWLKHKNFWDWKREFPLLILVSVVTSSYTWIHDQVVLIPVLMLILIWVLQAGLIWKKILISFVYIVINLSYLILHFKWDDSIFLWMGIILLILYLSASHYFQMESKNLQIHKSYE